jgi:hypothetical protein
LLRPLITAGNLVLCDTRHCHGSAQRKADASVARRTIPSRASEPSIMTSASISTGMEKGSSATPIADRA